MTDLVLQAGAELPRYTDQQRYFGFLALLVIFAVILFVVYRSTYAGMEEAQARHKAALLRAKAAVTPVSVRIPATMDFDSHREEVQEVIDGALAGEMPSTQPPTLRGAAIETHTAIRGSLRQRFEGISGVAITVGEIGIAVAILGSIAVSTDAVVGLIQDGPSGFSPMESLTGFVDVTVSVLSTGTDLLFQFPFVDILWAILLTIAIIGIQWAYEHWQLWAVLLLGLSVTIAALDRRVTEDVQPTPGNRAGRATMVFGALVMVWLAGVIPATIGRLAGSPFGIDLGTIGGLIGFIAALAMLIYWIQRGIRGTWRRMKRGARRHSGENSSRLLASYLALRHAGITLAVAASPLLVFYLVVIVVSGRGMRVISALLSAPLSTKAVIGLVLLVAVTIAGWAAREAEADLRSGIAGALSVRAVRIGILGRGMPLGLAAIGAIATWSMSGVVGLGGVTRVAATLAVALLFGLVGRGVYIAFLRTRHRISLLGDDEPVPTSLLVEAFVLSDADDDRHLFVRLNGSTQLAWTVGEDDDHVLDTVVSVGEQIAVDGDPDPTVAEWRAEDMLEHGFVDREVTWNRIKRMIHEDGIHHLLRAEGWVVDRERFRDALEDYPEPVRSEKLTEWKRHTVIAERGDTVELKRDPNAG